MSYYILPKKKIPLDCNPIISINPNINIISHSLQYHLKDIYDQIFNNNNNNNQDDIEEELIISQNGNGNGNGNSNGNVNSKKYTPEYISTILNPYEFVFTKVPDAKYSVSKIKPTSNIFFIFMEILHTFRLLEPYFNDSIKTLHFGKEKNILSTIECLQIMRDDYIDSHLIFMEEEKHNLIPDKKNHFDLLYFEIPNKKEYVKSLLMILCNILLFQSMNGSTIIKIDTIYHKPVLDILFILTTIYDKVYIIKPNISNILKSERYIVCKQMDTLPNIQLIENIQTFLSELRDGDIIHSILNNELPSYLLNKVEESNIIIGHQQLYVMDQLISIIKNKNIEDKLEALKKYHIQKSIQWCEKYKIPYNKFLEKINIFLPNETENHILL